MKEKTCFSTIAFLFFSHLQNFLKIGVYTHLIDLSRHQKFEKTHQQEAEILAHKIGKYENVRVD